MMDGNDTTTRTSTTLGCITMRLMKYVIRRSMMMMMYHMKCQYRMMIPWYDTTAITTTTENA